VGPAPKAANRYPEALGETIVTLEQELQQVIDYLAEREARKAERNHWIAEAMEAAFEQEAA
jgi:hypothetical protein